MSLNRGYRIYSAKSLSISLIIFSPPFTHLSIFPVHAVLYILFFHQFIFRLSAERSIFFSPRKQASVLHNPDTSLRLRRLAQFIFTALLYIVFNVTRDHSSLWTLGNKSITLSLLVETICGKQLASELYAN